jgi:hypothetical protein
MQGVALATLVVASANAWPQTQTNVGVPGRGNGSFGVTLQRIKITNRDLGGVIKGPFGEVMLRAAYFEFDYGLTDRLAVNLVLPYQSNRFVGTPPYEHDPALLINDHGETLTDDGAFHNAWGDFGVNLRWQWRTNPVAITPFVGYYWPSHDYPLFAEVQAGRGQWRMDLGLNAAGRLGRPAWNAYWQAGFAYSYLQETRPTDAPARRVNHSIVNVELGWRATPRLTPQLVLSRVIPHNALAFPGGFVGLPTGPGTGSDQFYYHDQLLGWEYTTWSLGVNYDLSDRFAFNLSYGRTLDVEFGHIYEPALTFGLSHGFSTRRASGAP